VHDDDTSQPDYESERDPAPGDDDDEAALAAESEALMHEGFERLSDGDTEGALRIAGRLEELRHSSAFEIAALAHAQDGAPEKAVEVLERGVGLVSDVWLLWQLLGNVRSDLERFDEALEAYDRALACPGANPDSIALNRAIALDRGERLEEALAVVEAVQLPEEPVRTHLAAERTRLLRQLGRHDAAEAGARERLEVIREAEGRYELAWDELGEDDDPPERPDDLPDEDAIADLLAALAWTRLDRSDRDEAEVLAIEAIQLHGGCEAALALLIELDGLSAEAPRRLELLVRGCAFVPGEEDEAVQLYRKAWIVAESAAQGLRFLARVEPPGAADLLVIEEQTDHGPAEEPALGLHWLGPRHYFDEDEDDADEDWSDAEDDDVPEDGLDADDDDLEDETN